ncbi:MAG: hypothetical protein A2017_09425 [Lentisphaerae bacterium GWF2_44_16]|nr:MAG: hypothetical protein A2017_09425 [Lentisphaerae bacterium GWF2_44_16]
MKVSVLCAVLFIAATLSARDITTLDGKTYKNVQISSVTPAGFDICYAPDKGGVAIKEIFFKDLPESIRKEFNYNPQKAEAFTKKVDRITQMRDEEVAKEYQQTMAQEAKQEARHDKYEAIAYAGKINVILNGILPSNHGLIAWAKTPNATVTTGTIGKVFIIGLDTVPNGGSWAGYIYPTKTTASGFPCYTITLEQAIIIMEENATLKKAKK